MPLLLSKAINDHAAYATWNIQETNEELVKIFGNEYPKNHHPTKLAEWIVGRILVKHLCSLFEIEFEGVITEKTGKPVLKNGGAEISISHSFPMAAAMIHLKASCGIDLERPRHKLIQIRDKFINGTEISYADDISKLCAIWCAKEVLFKIYSRKKLSLKDDTFVRFVNDHDLVGTINKSESGAPKEYEISLEKLKGYFLAYSK
ncbi:MAG: 4'-phosphopantetheinyl transferase superfamily protein [Cyclobacteriaceae bacterium]